MNQHIKKILWLVCFVMCLMIISDTIAGNRGMVRIKVKESDQASAPVVDEVTLYSSSHALVIGIDDYKYTAGWPRLSNAVRDAELVAEALSENGFEVKLLKNTPSAELEKELREFFIVKGNTPDARLFVWFSGHGYTDPENGEGFLVPSDTPKSESRSEFLLKALSMHRFGEYVRLAKSKHVFVVFDSCFSGTIFTAQRTKPPDAVTRAATLPVRQFLSSGEANQEVSDDGRFRRLFVRALKNEEPADANGDGYLTASELGMFLTDRVTNLTSSAQTPRYGKLKDELYDRGDFIFLLQKSPPPPTTIPPSVYTPPGYDPEAQMWELVKDSSDISDLKDYIAAYPNGKFAPVAKLKIKQLERTSDVTTTTIPVSPRTTPVQPFTPAKPQKQITNSIGQTFVYIEPGTFTMGSPENEPGRDDDETQHQVTLTKGFYMQTTEVTQGQWKAVMGNNPSKFSNCGDNCPVEQVSWDDVQEFIRKLNQKEGTHAYRLPTEAEWEYAARAGTSTPFSFGNCLSADQANYNGNYPLSGCSKGKYREKTVPVDSFSPNAWGLYNMHGNVYEWCQDWYGDYPTGAVTDPIGPSSGSYRVFRGGSWYSLARNCRSASRFSRAPGLRDHFVGFRLSRTP